MATTTDFAVTKDSRIARRESDNYDSGAGTGAGLAYGLYSGYRYRALLGFNINMAGWTSIVSAVFNYKTSDQINIAFGSDPTMLIQRLSANFSEGSAASLSASNAVIYPGPGAYSTNQVQEDAPTAENTWGAADITAMMRDALAAGTFYGIRILGSTNSSVESDSSANVGEIYSREGGSDAYIRIVYETNRAPNAPTISSPDVADGGLVGTQTPTLNVNMTDPDGNAINNYHWQIDDNPDFSSPIQDVYGGAAGASGVTVGVVPAALPRGGTYYFRVQAADVSVWGGWSTTFSFKVASVPALTLSEPSASGRLARLTYDAGSGWGSPRMVLNWAMSCPDGGSQASWRVEVYGDSAGAPSGLIEDITVGDTQSSRVVPYNLIEGNYYNVRVWATCSHGLTQAVGFWRVRARWGLGIYTADMGAAAIGSLALTTLDVRDETNGGSGRVVVEYQTTAAPGTPSVWQGSIGGAGLNRYFYYRVWLLAWGASPAVSPTLNQLKVTYSTSVIVPDKWERSSVENQTGDVGAYVYGTKSMRLKGTGGPNWVWQQVPVSPDTNYMLSGRIQAIGAEGTIAAFLDLTTAQGGGEVAYTPEVTGPLDFENPLSRRSIPKPWFSGSNTSIYVRCVFVGPVGTTAWFDAIKLEASTVVTPWSPGYVANAVVLDAGGLSIDAANGGIFRLRGSAGSSRDTVELGTNGLVFGGDTALVTPAPLLLQAGLRGSFAARGISGGAGGPSTNGYWSKVGHGSLSGQYTELSLVGSLTFAIDGQQEWRNALVRIKVRQQNAFGSPATVSVDVAGNWPTTHIAVAVTSTAGPTNFEVWVKSPFDWGSVQFAILHMTDLSGTYVPDADIPQQAALPSGTLYFGRQSGSGSTFPPGPVAGERHFHTAYNMEFYYDGTRWVSSTLYEMFVNVNENTGWSGAGSNIIKNYHPIPAPNNLQVAFYGMKATFIVAVGTLSTSNWWAIQVNYTPNDNFVGYYEVKAGATNVWRYEGAFRSAIPVPANTNLYFFVGKNGAPPPIYIGGFALTYRAIGI